MKVRLGFVSNSSSSSFIVIFPRKPKDAADVAKFVYGDLKYISAQYREEAFTADELAEAIWKEMSARGKPQKRELLYAMASGTAAQQETNELIIQQGINPPDYSQRPGETEEVRRERLTLEYDVYEKKRDKILGALVKDQLKKFLDAQLYTQGTRNSSFVALMEFEDHTDVGSQLEHGETFRRLPHIRCSHH